MAHMSASERTQCSKGLSYILRHGAQKDGYTMTADGYVSLAEIQRKGPKALKKLTVAEVQFLVDNNDKKRFRAKVEEGQMWLAANQGHSASLNLNPENFMTPITKASDVPVAVHGTFKRFLDPIKKQGLSKMSRQHIHFALGLPGAEGVISGMRKTAEVLIYLDVEKCLSEGIALFRSENNVILSPGDENGFIDPKFFLKIVET